MSRDHAVVDPGHREGWHDREAILGELRDVVASLHFCNSKRYPALLEYVVEHTLNGDTERLKERTLGVEVFGRRPDYDTNTDTIVRYTAGEVRKRLLLYYSELDHTPAIRISLPAGSYIPEFIPAGISQDHDRLRHDGERLDWTLPGQAGLDRHDSSAGTVELLQSPSDSPPFPLSHVPRPTDASLPGIRPRRSRLTHLLIAAAAIAVLGAAAWLAYRSTRPASDALSEFWAPVLRGQNPVLICTGSVIFAPQPNYSGTTTAGKDIDYTFVSMQIASAINQLGLTIDRSGDTAQLLPSATTPLTELREHSVILLGGYNNFWTMHLLEPLRFHFSPGVNEAIVDRTKPQMIWQRDRSLPYSSADDYAVVSRFFDPTIDGWVVVLAGIGRNGTEAAAHFVTDPHYIQLLRNRIGKNFADRNVEAILKVNVVDGKTGAPSILAVEFW